jgi:hypothetical protein
MAGINLTQAQAQLDGWIAASAAVQAGQSYKLADRELWRTDAKEIRDSITYWNDMVVTLTNKANGRSRARTVVTR